ncbi:non-ribosomal peptide synthetase, partial [Myxococcus sp. RHSTA-1-4]|uniref:non-ribosomal peptide synthetase n=1 Tax=Myxococcus sp. RHSTA-1-4 TaxID=2874601 RepID=UPI001CBFEDA2
LQRVRDCCLDAYSHQELPFEKLVEELRVAREPGRNPLVQVLFALQNAPGSMLQLPGLDVAPMTLETRTARFDLFLALEEGPEGLSATFEYATALFAPRTVERMASHYARLLHALVQSPDAPAGLLDFLSPDERRQLLFDWNDTARVYPSDASIAQLFLAQVALRPDAIAVQHGAHALTYAQLDARANRLAWLLLVHGVGRARPQVGVCLPRSVDLIVAFLAAIKAGGAYVPLDPDYPAERLSFMARDSRLAAIISNGALVERLPSGEWSLLSLDDLGPELERCSPLPPPEDSTPGDLAHIIYTSGSTGRPKGVCIPHQGVIRMARDSDHVRLGPEDRVAQVTTVAFDLSTLEIWGALLNGGALVIIDRDEVLEPTLLARRLQEERITALVIATALFNLTARTHPEAFRTLRWVIFGGEAADVTCVNAVLSHGAPQALVNGYGPTENTTFSTWFQAVHVEPDALSIPIGRPVSNSTAYVLDAALQPVPTGVAGELFVGGDGLAWGYWDRPELTAERFVPHPFSSSPGARLYRTGDLVRRRHDGSLDFVGRRDNQVKLRGFRIELGEVESALLQHPSVRQALVLVREDIPGDRRLVAYAASDSSAASLREHLVSLLPSHMVPSAFVLLDALPLSANGKLDRKALPAPVMQERNEGSFTGPRSDLEAKLTAIWASVLGVGELDVTASFFELGGHSLLATQVVSRVQDALGLPVPVRTLFEAPTVESFALAVEKKLGSAAPVATFHIPAARREGPMPLSFAQERLWFLSQLHDEQRVYNMPMAIRLSGVLAPEVLRESLRAIVQRHEALRTCFPGGSAPSQAVSATADLHFEIAECEEEDLLLQLLRQEAEKSFDLARGPLFRALLLKTGEARYVLLLNL